MHDYIGIGLGPANLSLAALLEKVQGTRGIFLEQKEKFSWHSHLLFDFSQINVGYYKDLVSLVDPTNPYSFMNYLVENGKQYKFFNADFKRVFRIEFESYYKWVANALNNVYYSQQVQKIVYDSAQDLFKIICDKQTYSTERVIVGVGIRSRFPDWFDRQLEGQSIFHSYDFLKSYKHFSGKPVLVIGGGQSAAEVIYALLEDPDKLPSKIYWVSTKGYPVAIDENSFANEIYTPSFSHFFYGLKQEQKESFNKVLKDTSDGINNELLQKIYKRLYCLSTIKKHSIELSFTPLTKVTAISKMTPYSEKYEASLEGLIKEKIEDISGVIFCTGYEFNYNQLLENLGEYYGDQVRINSDFSVVSCRKDSNCKLFLNNGAKAFFGPADPNLSLKAWRNATIINSLLNQKIYNLDSAQNLVQWGSGVDMCNTQGC